MIKLKETTDQQDLDFIPRYYTENASLTFKITSQEESTEVYNQTTTNVTAVDYYYRLTDVFTLEEEGTYVLKIYDGSNLIYQDVIFCTNQASTAYSINKDKYTFKANNTNEDSFVMYE